MEPLFFKEPVLSHCDCHIGNLLKKGTGENLQALLVDFEMISTAPGYVDIGTVIAKESNYNGGKPYLSKHKRMILAKSYVNACKKRLSQKSSIFCCSRSSKIGCIDNELDSVLFDIEIGFINRTLFDIMLGSYDQSFVDDGFEAAMELIDLMLGNIEKARNNQDLKLQIIEGGILDSVRPLFSKHLKNTIEKW